MTTSDKRSKNIKGLRKRVDDDRGTRAGYNELVYMLEETLRDKPGKYLFPLLLDTNKRQQHDAASTPILPLPRLTANKCLRPADPRVHQESFRSAHETFHKAFRNNLHLPVREHISLFPLMETQTFNVDLKPLTCIKNLSSIYIR